MRFATCLRSRYNWHKACLIGGVTMSVKRDVVQVKNPRTDRYVKIDRDAGRIVAHKKTPGPYKNIPVARNHSEGKSR